LQSKREENLVKRALSTFYRVKIQIKAKLEDLFFKFLLGKNLVFALQKL
jgi:hypothetical protein